MYGMHGLINWSFDLLACFAVIIFMFLLRLTLTLSKKVSKKAFRDEFADLIRGGQIPLLSATYSIAAIRSLVGMDYIPYFKEIMVAILVINIIFNFVLYILVKELEQVADEIIKSETPICVISSVFLIISIFGTFIYAFMQT